MLPATAPPAGGETLSAATVATSPAGGATLADARGAGIDVGVGRRLTWSKPTSSMAKSVSAPPAARRAAPSATMPSDDKRGSSRNAARQPETAARRLAPPHSTSSSSPATASARGPWPCCVTIARSWSRSG